jgi:hypothetical protein
LQFDGGLPLFFVAVLPPIRYPGKFSSHLFLPVLSYNSILAFEKRNISSAMVFTWKQQ